MQHLLFSSINLGIIIAVLAYFLRKPLADFMVSRHLDTVKEIKSVRELSRQAEEKFQDYSAKLKAIDVEVQSVTGQAQREADSLKKQIISNAEKISKTIIDEARGSLSSMLAEVTAQIRKDFVEGLIKELESRLSKSVTAADRERVQGDFSTQLKAVKL
jgi:F-type H+-transporting ATPase subunit b